jgi:hypothetical protein
MAAGKAAFILDDRPNLIVSELIPESDHGGSRRTILDHPEDLSFRTMTPKSVLVKVPGGRIQRCGDRTITCSALTMTSHAGSLALIERFPLGKHLKRVRERADKGSSFRQLVDRHSRLHHGLLRRSGRNPSSTDEQEQG